MRDFDELLDGVLREDASAEPRTGLEGRVMARVRVERSRNRWRGWVLVPAAACLGVVAAVWYVVDGGRPQPVSRISVPVFSAHSIEKSEVERPRSMAGGDGGLSGGGSGRALRDAHLSDGEAVAKMGHPVYRSVKRVQSATEEEPKLETFPAVSQKGDVAGWLGGSNDGKLATIASEITPAVVVAYQQLQAVQSEPIDIAAIEIKPLK